MLFEGRALEWMAEGGVAVVDIIMRMMFLCGCGVRVMWCMLVPWPCAFGSLFCSFSAQPAYRIVSYLCTYDMSLCVFFCVDTIS